jgi:Uma2 family endonuclease
MATLAPRRLTLDEFLEWDDGTDTGYELIEGDIVANTPAMPDHATIVSNLDRALGHELRPPRFVLAGAGVVRPDRAGHFYVPDLVATCVPIPPRQPPRAGPSTDRRSALAEHPAL